MRDQISTINLNTTVLKFFDKSLRDNSSILFLVQDIYGHINTFKKPITEEFYYDNVPTLSRSAYVVQKD